VGSKECGVDAGFVWLVACFRVVGALASEEVFNSSNPLSSFPSLPYFRHCVQLKGLLETEYNTLDCFKRENAKRAAAEKAKAKSSPPIAATATTAVAAPAPAAAAAAAAAPVAPATPVAAE
jgi:hypothetical protein